MVDENPDMRRIGKGGQSLPKPRPSVQADWRILGKLGAEANFL